MSKPELFIGLALIAPLLAGCGSAPTQKDLDAAASRCEAAGLHQDECQWLLITSAGLLASASESQWRQIATAMKRIMA